jgi:hypothetical protein
MRTSFHHQPEAQHPKSPAIETPAGRLPHLIATPVIAAAGIGWHNTGEFEVSFSKEWISNWRFPDGHVEAVSIPAGVGVVAIGGTRDGHVALRILDPNAGYGRTDVPADWLSANGHIWSRNFLDER